MDSLSNVYFSLLLGCFPVDRARRYMLCTLISLRPITGRFIASDMGLGMKKPFWNPLPGEDAKGKDLAVASQACCFERKQFQSQVPRIVNESYVTA